MLTGMQQPSLPTRLTRPHGWSAAAAVIAGAAMGATVGARVACALSSWLPGSGGCVQAGVPAGALVGALLALGALPLLGQGTQRGESAAHRPAPTTTTAARLVWLAIAAALGRCPEAHSRSVASPRMSPLRSEDARRPVGAVVRSGSA